jgi:hypothetical protein
MNVGDMVMIVKHGHLIYKHVAGDKYQPIDLCPEMVGKVGSIASISVRQGKTTYSLDIKGKSSWYNEDQLRKL